jgi:hypothetical protein
VLPLFQSQGQEGSTSSLALARCSSPQEKGEPALLHFACIGFFAGLILEVTRILIRGPARASTLLAFFVTPHSMEQGSLHCSTSLASRVLYQLEGKYLHLNA